MTLDPITEDRAALIRVMRAHEIPDQAIAEALGLSRQRIHKIAGARPKGQQDAPEAPGSAAPSEVLPNVLRRWRQRRRLTLAQAARQLGIPRHTTLSNWECGRVNCSMAGLLLKHLELLDRYEPPAR